MRNLARSKVHYRVRTGSMPSARALSCVDCSAPAVQYDHHLGYEGEAAVSVQAVCLPCHYRRGKERGDFAFPRRGRGRFGSWSKDERHKEED